MSRSVLLVGEKAADLVACFEQRGAHCWFEKSEKGAADHLVVGQSTPYSSVIAWLSCGGIALASAIRELYPTPALTVVGQRFDTPFALAVAECGGVIVPAPVEMPDLLRFVMVAEERRRYQPTAERYARLHGLSPRETQALILALAGHGREASAGEMGCSTPTVATYWTRICSKTRQNSQADVILDVFHFTFDRHAHRR